MSIRDVHIQSLELGSSNIILISETKGNPSKIDIQDENGSTQFSMDITVGLQKTSGKKERIQSKSLKIISEVDELLKIGYLLGIHERTSNTQTENLLVIEKGDQNNRALIKFYGVNGNLTGPKIYVKDWRS